MSEQAGPAKFDVALSASPRDSASEAAQMVHDRHTDLTAPAETAAVNDLQNRKHDAPVALS
ncbi:hypothetical protein [uncultured Sulfitobacter sp.]|uniref:hypothetical protein n=1 Tax=uncultured Sulfitobacter sp. TaxID=191468 RepID=UPI0026316C4C|nr:hypothetical protein [uncultured Sulfitobacter sp.]